MSKNTTGIYGIFHKRSGRVYIGQAAHIEKRWSVHKFWLRKGTHHSEYLQNCWNKYGETNFTFKILEMCEVCELDEKEISWGEKYQGKLLNTHPMGKQARGFRHSKLTKEKLSLAATKRANDPEERKVRSERARTQHKNGLLGRQTWTKEGVASFKEKSKLRSKGFNFLETIKKLRKMGWTQNDIGVKLGMSQPMIGKIIREQCPSELHKIIPKKRSHSQGVRKAISQASKRMWQKRRAQQLS